MNYPSIRSGIRSLWLTLFLAALVTSWSTGLQAQDAYLEFSKLTLASKALVKQNKEIMKLESIGQSAQGRDIWLLTLAKAGNTPINERPGILVAGNFEGDHLIGSSLTLAAAEYMANAYQDDELVKKGVDNFVFYFLPRLNPDGAEAMFGDVVKNKRTNNRPYDGDNDGRMDEDGPDDLNGDGIITYMRVKDPDGEYMIDPDEPGLMKKADPAKGETGSWSVYWEGIDDDKDGFYNEDPVGGVDINRNFMHAYPYYKDDAGPHMVSEPEVRALLDWILINKNIAMVLTFGESDNLITPPNSKGQLSSDRGLDLTKFADASYAGASKVGMMSSFGGRRYSREMMMYMMGGFNRQGSTQSSGRSQRPARKAATTFNTADLDYFNKVSEKYKELTGIKTRPVLRNPEGAFFQYAYFQYGIPAFSTPGWGIDTPEDTTKAERSRRRPGGGQAEAAIAPSPRGMMGARAMGAGRGAGGASASGVDKELIKYLKATNPEAIIEWTSFDHPELGEVEIGGYCPMAIANPAPDALSDLGKAHGEFIAWLATLHADVEIVKTEVVDHGDGLFRIKAEIANNGFLPTATRHGVTARSVAPTMVQLDIDPKEILAGNSKTNFFQSLEGSGNRQKYEWLIKGKKGDTMTLKVVSQKAGRDQVTIELK